LRDSLTREKPTVAFDNADRRHVVGINGDSNPRQTAMSSLRQHESERCRSEPAPPKGGPYVIADMTSLDLKRGRQLKPKTYAAYDAVLVVLKPEFGTRNPAGRKTIGLAEVFEIRQIRVEVVKGETIAVITVIAPVLSHTQEGHPVILRWFKEACH
jgi:hypothetical protein